MKIGVKLLPLILPTLLGFALSETWHYYKNSRPKLLFTISDTKTMVPASWSEAAHRYDITIWHETDKPASSVVFGIKPVPELQFVRLRFPSSDAKQKEMFLELPGTNSVTIVRTLKVGERLAGIVDTSVPISANDITLSSSELAGSAYIPWWRVEPAHILWNTILLGTLYGLMFLVLINFIFGGKVLKAMKQIRKDYDELGSALTKDAQMIRSELDELSAKRTDFIERSKETSELLKDSSDNLCKDANTIIDRIEVYTQRMSKVADRLKQVDPPQ